MRASRIARLGISSSLSHHSALQRHDVIMAIHADVAILQKVLAHEALMDTGRDPSVGHHLAGLAEAILRLVGNGLGALDDCVLRLFGALFGLVNDGLKRW